VHGWRRRRRELEVIHERGRQAGGLAGGRRRRAEAAREARCRCASAAASTRVHQHAPRVLGLDQALIWVCVALLAFGLVMVYSASSRCPTTRASPATPYHFLVRHTMSIGWRWWRRCWPSRCHGLVGEDGAPLFLVSLVLLIAVLIPHVGKVVNGARRWIGWAS
jgi:cell division protein FtsW (lipid II flippase)